jgi:hypothetical protein
MTRTPERKLRRMIANTKQKIEDIEDILDNTSTADEIEDNELSTLLAIAYKRSCYLKKYYTEQLNNLESTLKVYTK